MKVRKKPALPYPIEIIGSRSDGRSRYGLTKPLSSAASQNVIGAAALVAVLAFGINPGPSPVPASSILASWYDCAKPGECSRHKITASGERFNPRAMTAAHRSLPFGTRVRVTHGKRSVTVRINDRGPYIRGRSLDLSRAAARAIGCGGVCRVRMTVVRRAR